MSLFVTGTRFQLAHCVCFVPLSCATFAGTKGCVPLYFNQVYFARHTAYLGNTREGGVPPSALDRQCPSFAYLLEAELMGGATFVKNWADLRFVSGGLTNLRFAPVAGFSSSLAQEKNHIFRLALGLVYFFLYLFYA